MPGSISQNFSLQTQTPPQTPIASTAAVATSEATDSAPSEQASNNFLASIAQKALTRYNTAEELKFPRSPFLNSFTVGEIMEIANILYYRSKERQIFLKTSAVSAANSTAAAAASQPPPNGDFETFTRTLYPHFGHALANMAYKEFIARRKYSETFRILDLGAGDGTLAKSFMNGVKKIANEKETVGQNFAACVEYVMGDFSSTLHRCQTAVSEEVCTELKLPPSQVQARMMNAEVLMETEAESSYDFIILQELLDDMRKEYIAITDSLSQQNYILQHGLPKLQFEENDEGNQFYTKAKPFIDEFLKKDFLERRKNYPLGPIQRGFPLKPEECTTFLERFSDKPELINHCLRWGFAEVEWQPRQLQALFPTIDEALKSAPAFITHLQTAEAGFINDTLPKVIRGTEKVLKAGGHLLALDYMSHGTNPNTVHLRFFPQQAAEKIEMPSSIVKQFGQRNITSDVDLSALVANVQKVGMDIVHIGQQADLWGLLQDGRHGFDFSPLLLNQNSDTVSQVASLVQKTTFKLLYCAKPAQGNLSRIPFLATPYSLSSCNYDAHNDEILLHHLRQKTNQSVWHSPTELQRTAQDRCAMRLTAELLAIYCQQLGEATANSDDFLRFFQEKGFLALYYCNDRQHDKVVLDTLIKPMVEHVFKRVQQGNLLAEIQTKGIAHYHRNTILPFLRKCCDLGLLASSVVNVKLLASGAISLPLSMMPQGAAMDIQQALEIMTPDIKSIVMAAPNTFFEWAVVEQYVRNPQHYDKLGHSKCKANDKAKE